MVLVSGVQLALFLSFSHIELEMTTYSCRSRATENEHRDREYDQGLNFYAIYFSFFDFLHCELILICTHLVQEEMSSLPWKMLMLFLIILRYVSFLLDTSNCIHE